MWIPLRGISTADHDKESGSDQYSISTTESPRPPSLTDKTRLDLLVKLVEVDAFDLGHGGGCGAWGDKPAMRFQDFLGVGWWYGKRRFAMLCVYVRCGDAG